MTTTFIDGQIYPTRCPRCQRPTEYQRYRYNSSDGRGMRCEFCYNTPLYLDYFVKELPSNKISSLGGERE